MQPITVTIADSEYLIRTGLRYLLTERKGYKVVSEATSEQELLLQIPTHKPQVVILDYHQPGRFSDATIPQIKKGCADSNILIISADSDKERIDAVLGNGINSFLTKACDENEIFSAINATAKGERYFCSNVLNHLLEKSFPKDEKCTPTPLSQREVEIVKLIAKGLIAKEIAATLNLSTHTIYTHRKNIMKKLGMNTSSELVLYAVSTGLVEPE